MYVASVLWLVAAAAMIPAVLRLRDRPGRAGQVERARLERLGLGGVAVIFLAVALGFALPVSAPLLAGFAAAGLTGFLPALAAIGRGGRLRAEVWLTASAGLGLLALAVMAGELPLLLAAAPVAAQAASFSIGLAALDDSRAVSRAKERAARREPLSHPGG